MVPRILPILRSVSLHLDWLWVDKQDLQFPKPVSILLCCSGLKNLTKMVQFQDFKNMYFAYFMVPKCYLFYSTLRTVSTYRERKKKSVLMIIRIHLRTEWTKQQWETQKIVWFCTRNLSSLSHASLQASGRRPFVWMGSGNLRVSLFKTQQGHLNIMLLRVLVSSSCFTSSSFCSHFKACVGSSTKQ